jgi:hypothetical protein
MSPDEKRKIRMELQLDLEDAESDLAHLKESANANSDLLIQFAEWLRVSPEQRIFRSGCLHHGFDVQPLPEKYVQVLDAKELLGLGDKIRKAHRRVLELQERLALLKCGWCCHG